MKTPIESKTEKQKKTL